MRLIDGDALLRNIRRAVYPSDLNTTIAVGICESHVKDMPTIDAVPVVRCSECMYCFDEDRETPYDGESWWYCARWDKETNAYGTDPYRFFCADGERKEDENA